MRLKSWVLPKPVKIMKGKSTFTRAEANQIIELIKEKLASDTYRQKGIRDRIRRLGFYASDFNLYGGYTVEDFLGVVSIVGSNAQPFRAKTEKRQSLRKTSDSDEAYVLDLCDQILKRDSMRQHRFDFLKGDAGTKLPVDAYYPDLSLVVEYRELQHTESVKFFDRRQTVSGVGRREQRRIYDQRRREVLPRHGIKLIEISYSDFNFDGRKRIKRNKQSDEEVVRKALKPVLGK